MQIWCLKTGKDLHDLNFNEYFSFNNIVFHFPIFSEVISLRNNLRETRTLFDQTDLKEIIKVRDKEIEILNKYDTK